MKFVFNKALELKNNFGCIGVVVDAKKEAVEFYKHFGFIEINTIEKHITAPVFLSIKVLEEIIKKNNGKEN